MGMKIPVFLIFIVPEMYYNDTNVFRMLKSSYSSEKGSDGIIVCDASQPERFL
jgi:hypothetical protein